MTQLRPLARKTAPWCCRRRFIACSSEFGALSPGYQGALRRVARPWRPQFQQKTPQEQLELWLDYHADQLDAPNKPQHTYVARLLFDSGFTYKDICDYRQFTHIKWNDAANSHDIFQFNCISIPGLAQKASRRFPPPATRATSTSSELVHINASHTGPVGNITNILQQGRFLPSALHFPNNPGFFAQGVRITQQLQIAGL